ncbi:MAG: transcription termination/antitermination protein NusA [Ruminococcaceae bacterium]|nr:transcription termination/antitermination protein NusA [Oscillospiraceae bacterium]
MNAEFFDALDMLEQTRGIPKEYMLERVEAALLSAYKKERGRSNVRIAIDPAKKDIKVYEQKNVVAEVTDPDTEIDIDSAKKISRRYTEGSVVETEVKTKNFGRISAQTAKQVIIQGIREAERTNMIKEYEKRREEVVTATVTKVLDDTGDVVVDTGTSEAVLQKSEHIPGETLNVGDRIKVFITEVRRDSAPGPIVTLSRSHPGLVKRLFELEIPEITDGIVLIKGIAREAGSRTKIAVLSRDADVDAVGACIGNRGARIQEIVDELCGEKIDVISYSEIPEEYIAAALSPAEVKEVEYDGERSAKVIVDGEQLSLAIGKEGQNARLAARLTGYKIDIKGTKPGIF